MRSLLALLLCLAVGCSPPLIREPSAHSVPVTPVPGPPALRAGVDEVDITPPPGLSLFGHGPEGRVSRGHRGRLHCRTLFVADARGESIAWSVCDLAAPSGLLHREVSTRIARSVGLGADRFILSATHTHAGPAHYFGTQSYSGPLSTEKHGFDWNVVKWLADRIASSVQRAHDDAQRGGTATLTWKFGKLREGSTKNRSILPHCKNRDPMVGQPSACAQFNPNLPEPALEAIRKQEVDRTLAVLQVERRDGGANKLVGVFAVLAMHPTTIPNTNEVYHADVFGIATRRLHYELADHPVVAIANGIEGDVSPSVSKQSWSEAERVGRDLAADVEQTRLGNDQVADTRIERVYREIDLTCLHCQSACLCTHGEVGNAAAGGAEDGRTRFYSVAVAREGAKRSQPEGCHGPKRAWTAPLTEGPWAFPAFVPVHAVLLGGVLLFTLPFEITTTPGLELRRDLSSLAGRRVVLVGLSNEYLQYVTSAAEYAEQHYEGASMIYGPNSAAFFNAKAREFVGMLGKGEGAGQSGAAGDRTGTGDFDIVRQRDFNPQPRKHRLVETRGDDERRMVRQPFEVSGLAGAIAVEWAVPSGGGEGDPGSGALVRIERLDPQRHWVPVTDAIGAPVDDTGATLWVKQRRKWPTHFVAVWQQTEKLTGNFRFAVGRGARVLYSAEFVR